MNQDGTCIILIQVVALKKRERERRDGTEFSKHLDFDTISAKTPLLVFISL